MVTPFAPPTGSPPQSSNDKKKTSKISLSSICDSNNGEKVVGTMGGRGGSSRAAGTKMKSRRKGLVGALHRGIYEPTRTHAGTCNRTRLSGVRLFI